MGEYVNINKCKSFNQSITTSLTPLANQICSEVIVVNRTSDDIIVKDQNFDSDDHGFLLKTQESFTFRGITNSNQLSAIADVAGTIYYRTQYYSNSPSR
jgi:hypothetical protein